MIHRYGTIICIFLFTSILAAHPSAAQITLTADVLTDLIGETLSMTTYTSSDAQLQAVVEADGANQTWDFSQADISDTLHAEATYHGSAEGLPGGDEFPETNFAIEFMMGLESPDADSAAWVFNKIDADSAFSLGGSFVMENPDTQEQDTLTLSYDPPHLNFVFPLAYGETWTSTSTFFGTESTEEAEVDGWGTILLPGGSSYEALRLRREETTSIAGFSFTTTYIDFIPAHQGVAVNVTLAEDNETFASADITMAADITSAEDEELPRTVRLLQNYPNPFNPTTTLEYEIATPQRVTLSVHDMLGRRVAVLVDGMRAAGPHEVAFDASDLPSGTYIYRLRTAGGTVTRVMTLAK